MNIYEKIDKAEYISFDIFDTLIQRNIRVPSDVFKLVEESYNKKFKEKINDFKKNRILAEKKARRNSHNEEITLNEIYNKLIEKYGIKKGENFKLIEIEVEKSLCRINKSVYDIYKYAKHQNKKIIITSDMYLNKELIEDILKTNGIDQFEKLYLSSEIGLTKYKGTLYDYIIKEIKCDPGNIVHVGDNNKSDIIQAKNKGINTYKIEKKIIDIENNKYNKLSFDKINQLNIINSFIYNNINQEKNIYYKVGYEKVGILFYGFLQWINNYSLENKFDELIFLSRDGYILKKAYDHNFCYNKKINSSYMYASRRALIVPSFNENLSFNNLIEILGLRKKDTIKSFFSRIGLDFNNYEDKIKLSGYKIDDKLELDTNMKKLEKLFDLIKGDIIKNSAYEKQKLEKYINQLNIVGKKIGIIDIGWRGSMQYSLIKILQELNIKCDITGFYLGLNKDSKKFINKGIKAKGYLFDCSKNNDLEIASSSFVGLLETFFLAPHGSVIGYNINKNNKHIEPILDKLEYDSNNLSIINQVQKGAMDFIKDFSKYNEKLNYKINERVAFNNIMNLGTTPSKLYLNKFSNMSFSDFDNGYLAKPENIIKYLINPKKMIKDFFSSQWKVGFLYNLFKIKLPYFKLYTILKKIYEGDK